MTKKKNGITLLHSTQIHIDEHIIFNKNTPVFQKSNQINFIQRTLPYRSRVIFCKNYLHLNGVITLVYTSLT